MKQWINKIRKKSFKIAYLGFISLWALAFILYIVNLRLRSWVVFMAIFFLVVFLFIGITDFILKKCQKKLEKRITYFVMGFLFVGVLSSGLLLVSCVFKPEYVVKFQEKNYVAVVKDETTGDVAYYHYLSPFFTGITEKIHVYYKEPINPFKEEDNRYQEIVYTYYDEKEKVTLEERVIKGIGEEMRYTTYDASTKKPSKSEEYLLPEEQEPLYEAKFSSTILRVVQVDSVMPQNMAVSVLRSTDNGDNFYVVSEEPCIVSLEARFVFLNETLGFAISTGNLGLRGNTIYGKLLVTQDGGKTFTNALVNYENNNVDFITVEEGPFYENKELKLKCSVYQSAIEGGYEEKELVFISKDNGLSWDLEG